MAQIIRRFKEGIEYQIENAQESIRRLKFVGRMKLEGKELYLFRPVRIAKKNKP